MSDAHKSRVLFKLGVFEKDPFDPRLKNHKLQGEMKHLRSFRVSYDLRVVFCLLDGYNRVELIDVGGHGDVY